MRRRKFIGIIGIGTVIVVGGCVSFLSFDDVIKVIIGGEVKRLKLKVDQEDISSFIKGANEAGLWATYSLEKKELIRWCATLERIGLPLHSYDKYKWYRDEIVQQFLFSTSFFYDGMDINKPVHYLRIYDPYITPCCNPFSNLFYPG